MSTNPCTLNSLEKRCGKCLTSKPLSEFYPLRKGKYGRHSVCRSCHTANSIRWAKDHPERAKALQKSSAKKWKAQHPDRVKAITARYHLNRAYGITPELRQALIDETQGGKCACCHNHSDTFLTDHKHGTTTVRGFVCPACNWIIGMLESRPKEVEAAIEYIEVHEKMMEENRAKRSD